MAKNFVKDFVNFGGVDSRVFHKEKTLALWGLPFDRDGFFLLDGISDFSADTS
jgi:hypothetical protein